MSWGRKTIPDTYQNLAGRLTNACIARPINWDSLSRAVFSCHAHRGDNGQIPIAPITRFLKNKAAKPGGKPNHQSLNFS